MFLKYSHIMDAHLIRNLHIKQGKSIDETHRLLGVPYGSMKNACKKYLTEEQFEQLTRKRRRYTVEEKVGIIAFAVGHGLRKAAKKYECHRELIRMWLYEHGTKEQRRALRALHKVLAQRRRERRQAREASK